MEIKIKHQEDKTKYSFKVKDADKLTSAEVKRICIKMSVKALLVNGKYYSIKL
ncbi:hypothetical protein [Flavobacterium sp. SUN052]|uniref:hypothetical protein n=1 Tax=Flavobacterium sp. SUN052 TaxID=3002441 RepID=UPI002DBBB0FF|nr:hypothetical protein [Flavobacterium sp. SUN052]